MAIGSIVGAGLAFGQAHMPPPNYGAEVNAAQIALEQAIKHLEKVRDPHYPNVDRALAFATLAHTELGPNAALTGPGHPLPYNP
jgi:hypothetical protein